MTNNYYYKKGHVRGHVRHSPKKKKIVEVKPYERRQRYRNYAEISRARAQQAFNERSQRARTIDLKTTSKKTFAEPNEYWIQHIQRSDAKGIDTKTLKDQTRVYVLVKKYALERSSPVDDNEFQGSAIRHVFPSYKAYLEEWARKDAGITVHDKGPRKQCTRCKVLYDKRLLTHDKCPTCYWTHLHAVAHMGASHDQYKKEQHHVRRQLALYIKKNAGSEDTSRLAREVFKQAGMAMDRQREQRKKMKGGK